MKITIIDDEPDICLILGMELKALGHDVITYASALDAKTKIINELPDAILCDFQMPKMTGFQLFLWLKEQGLEVPFYILTGEPTMDKKDLLGQGIRDILLKPQDLVRLPTLFK